VGFQSACAARELWRALCDRMRTGERVYGRLGCHIAPRRGFAVFAWSHAHAVGDEPAAHTDGSDVALHATAAA
jgi:hypothetical protein